MIVRIQVAFDCADPARLSQFYAQVLGYRAQQAPPGFASVEEWLRARGVPEDEWNDGAIIEDPAGQGPKIFFRRAGTAKPVKNRLHLDFYVGNEPRATLAERKARVDPEVERVVALGARVDERAEDGDYYFVTLLDPEGNEFDVA